MQPQKIGAPQKKKRVECKICGGEKIPSDVSLRQKLSTLKAQSVLQTEEIRSSLLDVTCVRFLQPIGRQKTKSRLLIKEFFSPRRNFRIDNKMPFLLRA